MKYDKQNLINAARTFARDDFVFFWGHTDRQESVDKTCLSQWYMCSFMVEDVYYNCAEQYMMAERHAFLVMMTHGNRLWHRMTR